MEKQELLDKVNTVIDSIRPYLQDDGGDVELIEITDDKRVLVHLQGACGSCPHSIMTLKNGIEQAILREVPEIKEVVGV